MEQSKRRRGAIYQQIPIPPPLPMTMLVADDIRGGTSRSGTRYCTSAAPVHVHQQAFCSHRLRQMNEIPRRFPPAREVVPVESILGGGTTGPFFSQFGKPKPTAGIPVSPLQPNPFSPSSSLPRSKHIQPLYTTQTLMYPLSPDLDAAITLSQLPHHTPRTTTKHLEMIAPPELQDLKLPPLRYQSPMTKPFNAPTYRHTQIRPLSTKRLYSPSQMQPPYQYGQHYDDDDYKPPFEYTSGSISGGARDGSGGGEGKIGMDAMPVSGWESSPEIKMSMASDEIAVETPAEIGKDKEAQDRHQGNRAWSSQLFLSPTATLGLDRDS